MFDRVNATPSYRRPEYDPQHWWGIFYFNPNDRRLWVLKRTRLGWTLNFAWPMAWILMAAIVAFLLVARFLPALRGH